MPTRERPVDRGTRIARADLARTGSELRQARVAAGLSLREIGSAIGQSPSQVSRIERGLVPTASVLQLARIAAAVGFDSRVRIYPGPDPIRDIGQARVLERLRGRTDPGVPMRLEVPLSIPGDLRAWDASVDRLIDQTGRRRDLRVEVETRFSDAQAQLRRITIKMRDDNVDHVLLALADTPANRRAVAGASAVIAAMFPVSGRSALAALAEGRYPGGSSLIFI
jgi:transcriptional regulator with XRE-family HTH domain